MDRVRQTADFQYIFVNKDSALHATEVYRARKRRASLRKVDGGWVIDLDK